MKVRFRLNGDEVELEGAPLARLLDVLRVDRGLTGTKEGCGEGECGACTVLLDGQPVLSCLVPLAQLAGRDVVTVEGLPESARPMIDRLVETGGIQCGACTPGIVVTSHALLGAEPRPSRAAVQEALAGNLCRCTGYEGIFRALAHDDDAAAAVEAGAEAAR